MNGSIKIVLLGAIPQKGVWDWFQGCDMSWVWIRGKKKLFSLSFSGYRGGGLAHRQPCKQCYMNKCTVKPQCIEFTRVPQNPPYYNTMLYLMTWTLMNWNQGITLGFQSLPSIDFWC